MKKSAEQAKAPKVDPSKQVGYLLKDCEITRYQIDKTGRKYFYTRQIFGERLGTEIHKFPVDALCLDNEEGHVRMGEWIQFDIATAEDRLDEAEANLEFLQGIECFRSLEALADAA
jgi:hypothetical protein